MKTTKQSQGIKIVLVCILLLTSIFNSSAQNIGKAVEISSDLTGNGLGGNIYVGAILTRGNSAYSIGANLQSKQFNLSGMQANYRYTVFYSENKKTELFFLGNVTFHVSARMNNRSIKTEQMCRKEEPVDYNALSLKVIESYAGFGFRHNFTQRISTVCSIGCGGYGTLNKDYDRMMYRPKSAMALRFKVGVVYNFSRTE